MYRCDDCATVFSEDKELCPKCGSDRYDLVDVCNRCGAVVKYNSLIGDYCCGDCLNEILNDGDAVGMYLNEIGCLADYANWYKAEFGG